MARSESQGLQIAVILLTMCVVGLAISTWVYYQAADSNLKLKESADNSSKEAKKKLDQVTYAKEVFKYINGGPEVTKDQLNAIEQVIFFAGSGHCK